MSRPRIRTLKPDIWQHEKIGRLTHSERLLYVGLITMADDDGRLRDLPPAIVGHIFPYESIPPARLERWLQALAGAGRIHRYVAAGEKVIQIHGWGHQKINRKTDSELPPLSRTDHGTISEEDGRPHAQIGKDRKGRDEYVVGTARGMVDVFTEFGLVLSEVEAMNVLARFPSVPDPLAVTRGGAQYLHDHRDRPVGHTLHRYFERALRNQVEREDRSGGKRTDRQAQDDADFEAIKRHAARVSR